MRKIFYSSRVLVKCCTQEILCAHRLLKITGNIGPIHFVLYTADAENNRCAWPPQTLLHKRYFTFSFQSGWRPSVSSSIHPSLSFDDALPSSVAVYSTTVTPSHLVILKSDQLTPPQPWSPH